ncbi:MAG TPA: hypothetical protein VI423_11130 [Paenisporosarcina sp.]|nr:hypothetical protein [Paenisporosarcina sp.]
MRGIGIGTKDGKHCVKVNVSAITDDVRRIPSDVGGVPVMVDVVGDIVATSSESHEVLDYDSEDARALRIKENREKFLQLDEYLHNLLGSPLAVDAENYYDVARHKKVSTSSLFLWAMANEALAGSSRAMNNMINDPLSYGVEENVGLAALDFEIQLRNKIREWYELASDLSL